MKSIIAVRRKKIREAASRLRERTTKIPDRFRKFEEELEQLKKENNTLKEENTKLKNALGRNAHPFDYNNDYSVEQNLNESTSDDRPKYSSFLEFLTEKDGFKGKEDEWKKEYDTILNERYSLLDLLLTNDCASSMKHIQQQYSAFTNATAYMPLYESPSCIGNAQPFCNNHEYSVEQANMLPRPVDFRLSDYMEWKKPASNHKLNVPTAHDQSTRPKYSSFIEFLAAKTGFTPASGRYTPLGKMHFWNQAISPLISTRGRPITPVFEFAIQEDQVSFRRHRLY